MNNQDSHCRCGTEEVQVTPEANVLAGYARPLAPNPIPCYQPELQHATLRSVGRVKLPSRLCR
jgi:hypothetical protein